MALMNTSASRGSYSLPDDWGDSVSPGPQGPPAEARLARWQRGSEEARLGEGWPGWPAGEGAAPPLQSPQKRLVMTRGEWERQRSELGETKRKAGGSWGGVTHTHKKKFSSS